MEVRTAHGRVSVTAGDVVHVRPHDPGSSPNPCHHVHMAGADDLSEGEQSVLTLHPHWKTVLMPMAILIGLAIAAAVLLAVIPHGRLAGRSGSRWAPWR